jgi:hypothetical protein
MLQGIKVKKGNGSGITKVVTPPIKATMAKQYSEIVKVTPAMAKKFLAKSKNVRNLVEDRAMSLANQMLRGFWELNGQTLKFDTEGNLTDGQHRCRACIMAGIPFETWVVYNVPSSINIDTGIMRTTSQLLGGEGYKDANKLAASVNYIYWFQLKKMFTNVGGAPTLCRTEALQMIDRNPEIQESVRFTNKTNAIFNRHALHAALHFLFAQRTDFDLASEFYAALITGENLNSMSPIYHLREKLLRHKQGLGKLSPNPYAGLIIKGWNYWFQNKSIKNFRYNYSDEGIPVIEQLKRGEKLK